MVRRDISDLVLDELLANQQQSQQQPDGDLSAGQIHQRIGGSRPTVNRALVALVKSGQVVRHGAGPATRYRLQQAFCQGADRPNGVRETPGDFISDARGCSSIIPWAPASRQLAKELSQPLGRRQAVTYRREFVDNYQPNISSLLPVDLARELAAAGRLGGQQPAGTYARKILEPLLIDLSWHSSRLEGNRRSLLDTQALFARGRTASDDRDARMLLNHKEAIEFMIDSVPVEGISVPVIRNVQSLLMRDLLEDIADLGAIRSRIVHIQDSVYIPTQVPGLLKEMLDSLAEKARLIRNPVEAAFFLWVNLAYLQPFVDGNKRSSRLCANMPLMIGNSAPVSFLEVTNNDYALAMLGVYERRDVSIAIDLFEWTYRRSIDKYQVIVESMGLPDPLRARYREELGDAVRQVVFHSADLGVTLGRIAVDPHDRQAFEAIVREELLKLEAYNCARYRLPIGKTQQWIDAGRPL